MRGEHYAAWWPEVDRLERAQEWAAYEEMLSEMRDAAERGAQLGGWTVAPAPARRLAELADKQGDSAPGVEAEVPCVSYGHELRDRHSSNLYFSGRRQFSTNSWPSPVPK